MGQPPTCGLHSQGSLQRLAHSTLPVQLGVFQGSPLSPLLFVMAVQPIAAHARHLAARQRLHVLGAPLGQPAPFMHCHADGTIIHAASPADAAAIPAGSISLHCHVLHTTRG